MEMKQTSNSRPSFSLWDSCNLEIGWLELSLLVKLEKPVYSQRACRTINTTARWLSDFLVICARWNHWRACCATARHHVFCKCSGTHRLVHEQRKLMEMDDSKFKCPQSVFCCCTYLLEDWSIHTRPVLWWWISIYRPIKQRCRQPCAKVFTSTMSKSCTNLGSSPWPDIGIRSQNGKF